MNNKFKVTCDNEILPQDMFNIISTNLNNLKIINDNGNIYIVLNNDYLYDKDNFSDRLPKVLKHYIFDYLEKKDVDMMSMVSKYMHNIVLDYTMKKYKLVLSKIREEDINYCINKYYKMKSIKMCEKYFTTEYINIISKLEQTEKLTFTSGFNLPADILANRFPNLSGLIFDDKFNQPIDCLKGSFPNLQQLVLGEKFDQSIDELIYYFPKLKQFIWRSNNYNPLYKIIDVCPKLVSLVSNGSSLSLGGLKICQNLKVLYLGGNTSILLDELNIKFPNLTVLHINYYDKPLMISPNSFINIQELIIYDFSKKSDYKLANSFPNLEVLEIDNKKNGYVNNFLNGLGNRPKLKKLTFGYYYDEPIDELINKFPNLEVLKFGYKFNQSIQKLANGFPNLRVLEYYGRCFGFSKPFDILTYSFPKLEYLIVGSISITLMNQIINNHPYLKTIKFCVDSVDDIKYAYKLKKTGKYKIYLRFYDIIDRDGVNIQYTQI